MPTTTKKQGVNKGHRWKPGQSGNPKGRPPKGYSITAWFKEMLDSKPEVKEAIGKNIVKKALEGDMNAIKLIWGYMDGLPTQPLDHSGEIKVIPILGGRTDVQGDNSNPQDPRLEQEN